jgi:site-specific DNA recombinase
MGVGALAYLLKNRIYIGEVSYRGEVHRGEHVPILDRNLFEAVQRKLVASAVERRLRLKASPGLLTGRIHDERGNRMSPSHSNKKGARYRYYVSQAVLQQRTGEAGPIARVPAPEIEKLVLDALRNEFGPTLAEALSDRELIEQYLDRAVITPTAIELHLTRPRSAAETTSLLQEGGSDQEQRRPFPEPLVLPWAPASFCAVKGILHAPEESRLNPERREALLLAIAKARRWIDGLASGHVRSFAEIASAEGKGERLIRMLAPLAFLAPKVVAAIAADRAPANLGVIKLARTLPGSWSEQGRQLGIC